VVYKFKSQAAGDVIMLQLNGDQMLSIIGKEPSSQGIITVAQIPRAIAALEAASAAHETAQSRPEAHLPEEEEVDRDSIELRHRAAPFIDLLKSSAQAGKDVLWGV
jgi:cyclopropane-fatty-acyl-phospholipid synthase